MGLRLTTKSASTYTVMPWKNGQGTTSDVLLLPEGCNYETFDIRVSLAPITSEGPFSAFPDIERTITLLDGSTLALEFGDGRHLLLERLQPLSFDSGLAPRSRLPQGSVRVINVMTRRGRWKAQVTPLTSGHPRKLTLEHGGLVLLYPISGEWIAATFSQTRRIPAGDTLIAEGFGTLTLTGTGSGEAIMAHLTLSSDA